MNNEQFAQEIDGLFTKAKAGRLDDREARFDAVEALTERYFAENGEMPDYRLLDRLATLCLREEYIDPHPDKMSRNEYPIMSDTQLEERYGGEVSFTFAEEVGSDRRDYRPQTRLNKRKLREVGTKK